VPAEGNGDLQTLICVLVARPRLCATLSNTMTKLNGSLSQVHSADEDAVSWLIITRGQSNLTKSASRGAHSPVRGHPRGSKVVLLNSWGRVSY